MGHLLTYADVEARLGDGRTHILIGNGFSIACDDIFRYESLYDAAVAAGLSERAQEVFGRLGTNNFEGVMRALDDAHLIGAIYGVVDPDASEMKADVEVVKSALVDALARTHLDHSGLVPDSAKGSALEFLSPYHNIFCLNYDLLLYWVVMAEEGGPSFQDGFRADADEPDAAHLVFSERLGDAKGIFYIHGALHLHFSAGHVRKHSWIRSGRRLTDLIREGMDQGLYPLFVAEGSPDKKAEQINGNAYLAYCLGKLRRVRNRLVVFGHALGASDYHIIEAIGRNVGIREVYVGIYGDPDSTENRATLASAELLVEIRDRENAGRRKQTNLDVHFFDSASARVWRE